MASTTELKFDAQYPRKSKSVRDAGCPERAGVCGRASAGAAMGGTAEGRRRSLAGPALRRPDAPKAAARRGSSP
jgi:hypothetical protein